ncbi:hypothetical protein G9A89_008659 [Geosiphon pyriformis]|nr:hypothetical protein G9A89_008659 [Geosiphon pyriformis]
MLYLCSVKDKDLSVSWVKVKGHSGVSGNMKADLAAGAASGFLFSLLADVCKHFLVAESTSVFGNVCHFVRDIFRSVCHACKEAGPGFDVVSNTMIVHINWVVTAMRTSTNNSIQKVAELENVGANHLEFVKSLFQHYCQYLGLTHNHISAKSAFNFYVNEKIAYLLGTLVNTESARETFYNKLIQNTSLPTNHNFASIITKINKKIEHYTQQRYPITYTSKGKGKLQTPAVTPKKIQPPTWKKTRVESPTAPFYYYTSGTAIHITTADASTSNATSTFGRFLFQSKQREEDLLESYDAYFEGFKSQLPIPLGLRCYWRFLVSFLKCC